MPITNTSGWFVCVLCKFRVTRKTPVIGPTHLWAFCPYCVEKWARENNVPLLLPSQE